MNKSIFKLSSRVQLDEDEGADGGVLFDSHTAAISTCNTTALDILKILKKGSDVDSLARHMSDRYEVSLKDARVDVVAILKELTALEFVCEQK